jgi:hypothetical protein
MAVYVLVIGWTSPIDISLLTQGAAPSGSMAGMTAELVLNDRHGTVIDTTGDISIPDVNVWTVRYSPDPLDLVPGVYRMRVKITDSGGRVAYWPSSDPDVLMVRTET